MIGEQLYGISARGNAPVLFDQLELRVQPGTFAPDERSPYREHFIKEERLEVIDMILDKRGPQTGFEIVSIGKAASSAEFLGRFFKKERISAVPNDGHGISFIEPYPPFDIHDDRPGRTRDPFEIG